MTLGNPDLWAKWIDKNQTSYGRECIDVAREVMCLLDKEKIVDSHELVRQAGINVGATQLSPYMAGFVREIVQGCHPRGYWFSKRWDSDRTIYRVTPVPLPETEQALKDAEDAYLALKAESERERQRQEARRKWWKEKHDQLRHEITNLRRENDVLKSLVPLDFFDKSHESAQPAPKYPRGLGPPWELEYQEAGLL